MSGPKLSQAEIERRRQQKLQYQREEYVRCMTQLRRQKEQIRQWLQSEGFRKLSAQAPPVAMRLRDTLLQNLELVEDLPAPDMKMLDSYQNLLTSSMEDRSGKLQKLQALIDQEEMRLAVMGKQENKFRDERKIVQLLSGIRQDKPVATMIVGFDFDGDSQVLRAQLQALVQQMQSQVDTSQKKLVKLVADGSRILLSYAGDPQVSEKKEQVKRSMETILNAWQEELRRIRQSEALYQEYCVLCGVLGLNSGPAGAFADEKTLEKAVTDLKERYRKKDEMDYIASQINEVMIQLGYRFVSSTALQRKDGSEYDYSLYQADADAGISIYTDESGAVMMQMTNLGDGAVTSRDEDESYQMQLDFCASHPDIVQALAARGVLLRQVNYLPPSRKYVVKKKVTQQATKEVVDRRKRRRYGKKVRYMQ